MNTQFVKIISSLALIIGFTQVSLASSDENSNTCLLADTKTRGSAYKIRAIDLTTTVQPMSHLKDILADRKIKELSSPSSGQSFLNYQINGESFTKAFRVKNRIFCSVPDVTEISTPDVTKIGDIRK